MYTVYCSISLKDFLGTVHYLRAGRGGDFEGDTFWQLAEGGGEISSQNKPKKISAKKCS